MRNEKKAYHMLLTIIDMLDEESNLQTPVLQVIENGQTVAGQMDISTVSVSNASVNIPLSSAYSYPKS